MRLPVPLALLLLLLGTSACRKKAYPQFYELEAQQERLVSAKGDEAYLSTELAGVITALDAVPEDTLEKERAVTLAAHLKAEQERVRAVEAAKPVPAPVRPPWGAGARQVGEYRPDPSCLNDCDAKAVACLVAQGCVHVGTNTSNNGRGEVQRSDVECADARAAQAACAEALRCNETCKP